MGAAQHVVGGKAKKDGAFTFDRKWVYLIVVLLLLYSLSILDYMSVEKLSFTDAVFETLCTSVYVDCGNFPNVTTRLLRVLLGAFGAVVLIFIVSTLLETFLRTELGGRAMKKKIKNLKNHYIICGYGSLGKAVAQVLEENGEPYVVIELDKGVVDELRENDVLAVHGNALSAEKLKEAGLDHAKVVVSALGSDADNVFLTLTLKELNPRVLVGTRAFSEGTIGKLHSAGAEFIVMPEMIGGLELAKELLHIRDERGKKLVSRKENHKRA